MKRTLVLAVLLLFSITVSVTAQTKSKLAVLPFTGGDGQEGDTLANLFASQNNLLAAFTVIPRTNAASSILTEQRFQRSGLTDSDTIAQLGRQLNAEFVATGHITSLGTGKVVIISVVNVETLEQLGGAYQTYNDLANIRSYLPEMVNKIVSAVRFDTSRLPKLAVLPFDIAAQGVDLQAAEILAQLLATEVANTHRYAVLPRTTTVERVMSEQQYQRSGMTDRNSIKAIGQATNSQFVLSGSISSLGSSNLFMANVLAVENASIQSGESVEYFAITDGLSLMGTLGGRLGAANAVSGGKARQTSSAVKPAIAVLPFTGGQGSEGDTLATLFASQANLIGAFTVIPRTNAVNSILTEQHFQRSGLTDSDTIARLGRQLNAEFVITGHITSLGTGNVVIISIVNVESLEQLGGDYHTYRDLREIRGYLGSMADKLISAARFNTSRLSKLAILPFSISTDGIDQQAAEVLAQLLATEIANTHKYAVLPRTTTVERVMTEQQYQRSGMTDPSSIRAIGQATNSQYVLSGTVSSLGSANLFMAQILSVEDASLLKGDDIEYRAITDGLSLMGELSLKLTGVVTDTLVRQRQEATTLANEARREAARIASELRAREQKKQREEAAQERKEQREEAAQAIKNKDGEWARTWKNSTWFLGAHGGFTSWFNEPSTNMEYVNHNVFDKTNTFEGGAGLTMHFLSLGLTGYGLTAELLYSTDEAGYKGTDSSGVFAFSALEIPLLANLYLFIGNNVLVRGKIGMSFIIPLGSTSYTNGEDPSMSRDYESKVDGLDLVGGGSFGIRLGKGSILADIRYSGGAFMGIKDGDEVLYYMTRRRVAFTFGYEIGF
ncbi:MAG: outer membrane beta-barrel protein [Treponema sp.]|nr:outer membrane beta-barrel protein [Treponema sp.]